MSFVLCCGALCGCAVMLCVPFGLLSDQSQETLLVAKLHHGWDSNVVESCLHFSSLSIGVMQSTSKAMQCISL